MSDDLLQRLLMAIDDRPSLYTLRAELAAAVAGGARLVMPDKAAESVHLWNGRTGAACGAPNTFSTSKNSDSLVTCPDCRRILDGEKAAEPVAEVVHWWDDNDPNTERGPFACGAPPMSDYSFSRIGANCPACLAIMHAPEPARCGVLVMEAFR